MPTTSISTSTPPSQPTQPTPPDWSAQQYLKFAPERTLAIHDLLSRTLPYIPTQSPIIHDLGCGPGTSTSALLAAVPGAQLTGMDSSPDMLARARAVLPGVDFVAGDLATYAPAAETDVLFSNAVFHWLRRGERIGTLVRLFEGLKSGGVVALQVPDNYDEPSHRLMRETALNSPSPSPDPDTAPGTPAPAAADAPWLPYFATSGIGDLSNPSRPDLDPIESPREWYNALAPHAACVHIWRTTYQHVLADAGAIVEWVRGTGLQPYVHRIAEGDEAARRGFLAEYERRLRGAYPALADGRVMLGYPRLFVVAVRK
ncbi:S-adenosyl-L-methionine-dependent methyltransferase [Trematosphaeria pertusa]|uniref:S-adenosyl-L-methionine-dependent methyltransferase n=1 Tax=Trematosphaeria pertusa TaxID=390896 RepID=A0A6A6IQI8_9PLEO|nr:S-adenosyl-L-methionine-dependent methyltransferase [Trematosphaeria pertusa]KAF2252815.1 S-adenosyl-L-methionine-dependent methyltransferase [Trematosphaeria pertusa]